MATVTVGELRDYLKELADAVVNGKMQVTDADVKTVLDTIKSVLQSGVNTYDTNALAELQAIKNKLNGTLLTQLTGSKVEIIREWINVSPHIGQPSSTIYVFYDAVNPTNTTSVPALDVSKYSKRLVHIENLYNQAVKVLIYRYKSIGTGSGRTIARLVNGETLAAGASKVWDESNTPGMDAPYMGLTIGISSDPAAPTTGSLNIVVMGGIL